MTARRLILALHILLGCITLTMLTLTAQIPHQFELHHSLGDK